ncbi:acyl-CoA dehydratase activase [Desulfosarcina sp. OttesenSCG-928-A07]|nr:acyl-CoA dehydratase activase [Desulfosarcina sp. OttesenSCG-928-A07]
MTQTDSKPIFAGVDVGSSHTKVAIVDAAGNLLGHGIQRSGLDFSATANACMAEALKLAGCGPEDVTRCISTGYGRHNVAFATGNRTEIGCHAGCCHFYFPEAITVIDIGGQDNKIIKLDEHGRRISFKLNRKCAAGTGAFLEEMSTRLGIGLADMDALSRKSTEIITIGSYCTVFSATEVLEYIRHGKKPEDIVRGLYVSVIRRILEMDALTDHVVMTGGVVAHHPHLVRLAEEITGRPIRTPPFPQLAGAMGAALQARDKGNGEK